MIYITDHNSFIKKYPNIDNKDFKYLGKFFKSGKNIIIYSKENNIINGIGELEVNPYDTNMLWIMHISIHPEYRDKGIASQIADKMFEYAKDNNKKIKTSSYSSKEGLTKLKPLFNKLSKKYNVEFIDAENTYIIDEKIEDKDLEIQKSLHDELNPSLWNNKDMTLKKDVREKMLEIADEFWKFLDIKEHVEMEDVLFTGSNANYNFTETSDCDLHIVVNFNKLHEDKDFVRNYFDMKKFIWGKEHNIKIDNYDVECYVQDSNEKHISTGIYSVINDKWIVKPHKFIIKIDKESIRKKAVAISDLIDHLDSITDEKKKYDLSVKIKDKIKAMRKTGLQKEGEFSAENLAFKVLRRTGYLEKLTDIKNQSLDKVLSLNQ